MTGVLRLMPKDDGPDIGFEGFEEPTPLPDGSVSHLVNGAVKPDPTTIPKPDDPDIDLSTFTDFKPLYPGTQRGELVSSRWDADLCRGADLLLSIPGFPLKTRADLSREGAAKLIQAYRAKYGIEDPILQSLYLSARARSDAQYRADFFTQLENYRNDMQDHLIRTVNGDDLAEAYRSLTEHWATATRIGNQWMRNNYLIVLRDMPISRVLVRLWTLQGKAIPLGLLAAPKPRSGGTP